MVNDKSLMVTQSFYISLDPLIVSHRFVRLSERGVNCEWTMFTGNKNLMGLHVKGVRFNDPVTLFHGGN